MTASKTRLSDLDPMTFDDLLGLDDRSTEHCPACGSRVTMLTMLVPGERECWETDCLAVWKVE